MHVSNRLFWEYHKYQHLIKNASVVEFGSMNVNGSARGIFTGYQSWTGVDWREGDCVEVVSLAHEAKLGKFDVVFSCSMLEHDPYWRASISNMVNHLKEQGILFLSWGSARNAAHCWDTAVDGGFHPLPVGRVFELLSDLDIYIHEFWYERGFVDAHAKGAPLCHEGDGLGEVCLVAFTDSSYAIGKGHIDELLPEDAQTQEIHESD